MSQTAKGSIVSAFPDSIHDFLAQSELRDPISPDPEIAEGKDANRWSAELQALLGALGVGGRGEVEIVAGPVANIGSVKYVYLGTQKEYLGTTGVPLTAGQNNFIFLDPSANSEVVNTTGFPITPHIRLANWDDSGPTVFMDSRPHDFGIANDPASGATFAKAVLQFDFNDEPDVLFKTVQDGGIIKNVGIKIEIPFSAGATISVGTDASPELVVESTDVDAQAVGLYFFELFQEISPQEDIKIFINGTPGVGEGLAIFSEA